MQHLNPERLAALADEPATLVERTHLAACAACSAELTAAQRLVRMAMTDTPAIERPLTSWERLAPALRADGLIQTSSALAERPVGGAEVVPIAAVVRTGRYRWAMQAAAGLFLAVGGAVIGRASAPLPEAGLAAGGPADTVLTSSAEALAVLDRASEQYQRAVAYLAANDSMVTMPSRDVAEIMQARLEVLDQGLAATRRALYTAPQDPVLNQYYMTTLGARDYTLRQLGEVVPVSSSQRARY